MVGVVLERGCHAAADQQQQQCWGTRVRDSQPRLTPHQQQQQQWHRQQQQQGQPSVGPATSPSANRAYKLYSEFVRAGQWARFTVEQRRDGEYITLLSRPMATAATAAVARAKRKGGGKPNLRRKEKISEWRRNHQTKPSKSGSADQQQHMQQQHQQQQQQVRQQQWHQPQLQQQLHLQQQGQQQQPGQQQQQQFSQQQQPQQQQVLSTEVNAGAASIAVVVGTTVAEAAPAHASSPCSSPVILPMMTRARKKRKAVSPVSPADCTSIIQVDGSTTSPPPSPTAVSDNEEDCPTAPLVLCARANSSPVGPPTAQSPPEPPPWSRYLPSHPRTVICGMCLAGCHGLQFNMCHSCYSDRNSGQ